MDTNIEQFVVTGEVEKPIWLRFSGKNIMLTASGAKELVAMGFERAVLKISRDKTTVAIIGVTDGNAKLRKTTGLVQNVCMRNAFISNIVAGKTRNGSPKYKGVLDKKKKCIFFDLDNPVFDKD